MAFCLFINLLLLFYSGLSTIAFPFMPLIATGKGWLKRTIYTHWDS